MGIIINFITIGVIACLIATISIGLYLAYGMHVAATIAREQHHYRQSDVLDTIAGISSISVVAFAIALGASWYITAYG